MEQGLKSRDIRSSMMDSQGYMWFATEIGAYQFDGYTFKPFQRIPKGGSPLLVKYIKEDDEQNLWLFHDAGTSEISIIPPERDTIFSFQDFFKEKAPFESTLLLLRNDNNENGIFLLNKDRILWKYSNGQFQKIFRFHEVKDLEPINRLNTISIYETPDGGYWLASIFGLYHLNQDRELVLVDSVGAQHGLYIEYSFNENGNLVLFYGDDCYVFEDEETPKQKYYKAIFNQIPTFEKWHNFDQQGKIIVQKSHKLSDIVIYDKAEETSIKLQSEELKNPNVIIQSFFMEDKNTLWINSLFGIYRVKFRKNPFRQYFKGFSTRGISKFESDELGVLLVKEFESDSNKNNLITPIKLHAYDFFKDQQGRHWSGGASGFIYQHKSNDKKQTKLYLSLIHI